MSVKTRCMGKKYIQSVRGTHDLIGKDMQAFRQVITQAQLNAAHFGYDEISTPIFEFSDVFHRSLGDSSDVVSKETYSFDDRGGESITLRPEFTASIVRAFISNGYTQQLPFKVFYAGPAFRYERPQKGRQRQFHQVGVECLGAATPDRDVEAMACAHAMLQVLLGNTSDHVTLELNTLGDDASRAKYRDMLVDYLSKYRADLSQESQIRLEKNPLRILDSKQTEDREIILGAPNLSNALSEDARQWFDAVRRMLDRLDIAHKLSPRLVRGLDYYAHTVFEFTTDKLGAQATILAGGRYNGLVEQMGGPDIAGVGWAAGVERLVLLRDAMGIHDSEPSSGALYINAASDGLLHDVMLLCNHLRHLGVRCDYAVQHNASKANKKAVNQGAVYFIHYDEREQETGQIHIKNLKTGVQSQAISAMSTTDIIAALAQLQEI